MPEYLYQEPWRVWRAWRGVRKQPAYRDVRRTWLRDLFRDRTLTGSGGSVRRWFWRMNWPRISIIFTSIFCTHLHRSLDMQPR